MIVQRTERHMIKKSRPHYVMLKRFCHLSKNLYNQANYVIRQSYFRDGSILGYCELDKVCKANIQYPDYKAMPTAQAAQQTLRLLSNNWKAYLKSLRDWRKNPGKYLGKPKPPKFLKKSGYQVLTLTNQNCRLKDGKIMFPKVFEGFKMTPLFLGKSGFKSFQQVRIVPGRDFVTIELVYNLEILNQTKPDNDRHVGIDIGVDNLATVANDFHGIPVAINGRPLKSINQYYNKKIANLRSDLMKKHGKQYSNRMNRLCRKRNGKIKDYMHKASRKVIDYCVANDVSKIVIGWNKNWKQNIAIGKRNNQNFMQIPFHTFIKMLMYKAEEYSISVILTEESYTSGTSFIDDEMPVRSCYDKSRRKHRGLFIANNGMDINADLNGAYQIIKKVVPIKWDRGCVLHPVILTV